MTTLANTRLDLARGRETRPLSGERVYLAARFGRQTELRNVAADIEVTGAVVVSSWLQSPRPVSSEDLTPSPTAVRIAQADLHDLRRATLCIAFTESEDSYQQGRGGRHVELGVAIALGLQIILVGPREHVFHCIPGIQQFATWGEAREALAGAQHDSGSHV